ncbi:MAG TPA: UDP-N-acetylglucosamine 2-epimerase [Phycisphaerales bacterium]|nr:UDP-N-acetylglucosamine 2-epimerase [Phycisphaerales bacterium]
MIKRLKPDWIVVLGDRIEAFAAATAASIAGVAVCHIHGGDRAEGIADEAMRHAITKLSHLHCAATKLSAERIVKMGEPASLVHVTGSPAIDGLRTTPALPKKSLGELAKVGTIVLLHPSGTGHDNERSMACTIAHAVDEAAAGDVLVLAPNRDPGGEVIDGVWRARATTPDARIGHVENRAPGGKGSDLVVLPLDSQDSLASINGRRWFYRDHLPREQFLGLLKRVAKEGYSLLVGNSSAGLIEAAALGVNVVNVGPRQAGRERAGRLIDVEEPDVLQMVGAINLLFGQETDRTVLRPGKGPPPHPYGDGRAGPRIAALLAKVDPNDPALLRKRIAY